jgi:hypothetical protein
MATRWRIVLAVALALTLLALVVPGITADGPTDGGTAPSPRDVLCVEGTVINHQEQPITGWTVTATPFDNFGNLDPGRSISQEVDENGAFRFDGLTPGMWNFTIMPQEGWVPVTADSFDVPVDYGRTSCLVIRFKMRQLITVRVFKIDANHTPLEGWIIRARPGPGNLFAIPQEETTDANGIAVFKLSPGLWIFTEQAPPGTNYVPVSPPTGVQQVDIQPPGPYEIRFKNRIRVKPKGCIEVIKRDVPPEGVDQPPTGLPGWHIIVERVDGSIAAQGTTDAFGHVKFENLPLGPYTVREDLPPGWEAATPTSFEVTLTGMDQCEIVEFFNRQVEPAFCIEGRKVDTNGLVGLPDWQITADPIDPNGYWPDPVYTDGLGHFRIDFPLYDYRIPGAKYRVCEEIKDGWLPHTSTCQTVKLPYEPGACVQLKYDFENQQVGHGVVVDPPGDGQCSAYHTVQAGEGLFAIGRQYGVTPQQILDANPWVRSQPWMYLYRGQRVCIP